jgi:hypothetical protein
MSMRAALVIGSSRAMGLVTQGGRIISTVELSIGDDESLACAVESAVSEMKLRGTRSRIRVVLGPPMCQTRFLPGLVAVKRAASAAAIVRNQAGTWFRFGDGGLTAVRLSKEGVWAEWFHRETVRVVSDACTRAGCRVLIFTSVPTAMAALVVNGAFEWRDDEVVLHGECRDGRVTAVKRLVALDVPTANALSRGASGAGIAQSSSSPDPRYAPARGALRLTTRSRPGITSLPSAKSSIPQWRVVLASVALVAATLAALGAPVAALRWTIKRNASELVRLRPEVTRATRIRSDLASVEQTLATVSGFKIGRISWLRVLADLTDALPPDAALSRFDGDRTAVSISAVATRALDVVASVESAGAFLEPEVVGQIAQERLAELTLERAVIRFGLQGVKP